MCRDGTKMERALMEAPSMEARSAPISRPEAANQYGAMEASFVESCQEACPRRTAQDAEGGEPGDADLRPRLPPELLGAVMERLATSGRKRTLLRFILASRQCQELGLPSLLRQLDLSGWDAAWLIAFSRDGLGANKFRHIRSLKAMLVDEDDFLSLQETLEWGSSFLVLLRRVSATLANLHLAIVSSAVAARAWEAVRSFGALRTLNLELQGRPPTELSKGQLPKDLKSLTLISRDAEDAFGALRMIQKSHESFVDLHLAVAPLAAVNLIASVVPKIRSASVFSHEVELLSRYPDFAPHQLAVSCSAEEDGWLLFRSLSRIRGLQDLSIWFAYPNLLSGAGDLDIPLQKLSFEYLRAPADADLEQVELIAAGLRAVAAHAIVVRVGINYGREPIGRDFWRSQPRVRYIEADRPHVWWIPPGSPFTR
ncbi:hypothetical protein DFJ74DRAFT_441430 [Hyaloraphidium curvatum]|nr:hypothetical protein DFJ74DRAFT_441430 [Hyaloraphidium curvatum]